MNRDRTIKSGKCALESLVTKNCIKTKPDTAKTIQREFETRKGFVGIKITHLISSLEEIRFR